MPDEMKVAQPYPLHIDTNFELLDTDKTEPSSRVRNKQLDKFHRLADRTMSSLICDETLRKGPRDKDRPHLTLGVVVY